MDTKGLKQRDCGFEDLLCRGRLNQTLSLECLYILPKQTMDWFITPNDDAARNALHSNEFREIGMKAIESRYGAIAFYCYANFVNYHLKISVL